jgi:hypothetical protein
VIRVLEVTSRDSRTSEDFKLLRSEAADGFLARDGFRKVSKVGMLEAVLVGRHCYLTLAG